MIGAKALERFDDSRNPVLVKELRQAMHGRFFSYMLILLNIALLICLLVVSLAVAERMRHGSFDAVGGDMFAFFLACLFFSGCWLIPMYLANKLVGESDSDTMNMLYATTIRPWRIIFGKYLNGLMITAMFYFTALPYMVVCFLFRGIDVLTITGYVGLSLLPILPAQALGLTLGAVPLDKKIKRGLLSAFFILAVLVGVPLTIAMFAEFVGFGRGRMISSFGEWFLWLAPLSISLTAVLLTVATAMVSPPTANRVMPMKVVLFVLWLLWGAAMFIHGFNIFNAVGVWAWFVVSYVLSGLGGLLAAGERLKYGPHVLRQVPRRWLWRRWAFPFFSGAANSYQLVFFTAIVSFAAMTLFLSCVSPLRSDFKDFIAWRLPQMAAALAAVIGYGLFGVNIKRWLFGRRWPRVPASIYGMLLGAVLFLSPTVAVLFCEISGRHLSDKQEAWFFILSFSGAAESPVARFVNLAVCLIFMLVMLAFAFPGLRAMASSFKPFVPERRPGDEIPLEVEE